MICKYCRKELKNQNSLVQHEIRCILNENKITVKSNFIGYNDKIKNGEIEKHSIYKNHYDKAKKLGLPKPVMEQKTIDLLSKSTSSRIWTDESKEKLSNSMIEATRKYPESYSVNNVSGRTKMYKAIDTEGNLVNVKGTWEMLFAEYLNDNLIKWTNKIEEKFEYVWEGKTRIYYPDFYLNDYNTYIEVKGYTRERDLVKWEIPEIRDRLIKIKLKEIKQIKSGNFRLLDLIK
jgi:hypothetical protein